MTKTKKFFCHSGNVHVFDLGQAPVYGGGTLKQAYPENGMIVLDLANEFSLEKKVHFLNCSPPDKLVEVAQPDYSLVQFDWDDMGVPLLSRAFWHELVAWLWSEGRPVLACCLGGHGRTGTTLAILASLGGVTKGDPVAYIRRKYCREAVETQGQINYIEAITGKVVKVRPSAKQHVWSNAEFYGG